MKKTLADIIILWVLKLGITMLIRNKDDIEFVTEFLSFLEHPVGTYNYQENCPKIMYIFFSSPFSV